MKKDLLKDSIKVLNDREREILYAKRLINDPNIFFPNDKDVVSFIKNFDQRYDKKLSSKLNFSRVFVESGLTLVNFLINNKLLNNIYIFKTDTNLNKNGFNNSSNKLIKKIKLKNKLQVYLNSDSVYLERLN